MTYVRIASRGSGVVPFALTSMAEISAPAGCNGTWHHYVIMQGANRIEGMRSGSRDEVDLVLANLIDRLNGRFAQKGSWTSVMRERRVAALGGANETLKLANELRQARVPADRQMAPCLVTPSTDAASDPIEETQ